MRWINWVQLILGIWIFVSPWVLNFSAIGAALWSNIIAGVLIGLSAFWELMITEEK
jgi:hypothetical protein